MPAKIEIRNEPNIFIYVHLLSVARLSMTIYILYHKNIYKAIRKIVGVLTSF